MQYVQKRTLYLNGFEFNRAQGFCSNYVSTTKYSVLSFLPKALFFQFKRVANVYFLAIAILQSIPAVSPLHPFGAVAPLVFVLFVSLLREAIEDLLRYRSDVQTNKARVWVYRGGQFVPAYSKDIAIGDIVFVEKDQSLPCDLVLLSTFNESEVAYIETSTLDGEKALKPRHTVSATRHLYTQSKLIRLYAEVQCELPNPRIYQFSGTLKVQDTLLPLDAKHLLLCGAVLKSPAWAVGAAVYTGSETKLQKNSMRRSFKQSQVERAANQYIVVIICIQFVLCALCAILSGIWEMDMREKHTYLGSSEVGAEYEGVLAFFTYFLLLNTMIPISLIITLELVKLLQGVFMEWDQEMYCELRDRRAKVSSFSLNEELGMIQHIFTDKTGTLTCNQMEFRHCTVGLRTYGDLQRLKSKLSDLGRELSIDSKRGFNWAEVLLDRLETSFTSEYSHPEYIDHFLRCMALCHECIVDTDSGSLKYTGQSPDEVTILTAAQQMGYTYLPGLQNEAKLQVVAESATEDLGFDRLCVLEFDSNRKCNSVLLRDQVTQRIYLYMKGADSVMKQVLSPQTPLSVLEHTVHELQTFAHRGLRTLVLGYRIVSEEEFTRWYSEYTQAAASIEDRQARIAAVAKLIEKDLTLLGCTAIEDNLQDQVPQTIYDLTRAGVKIWMLTGDKLETAENIGRTCTLIEEDMHIIRLREDTLETTSLSTIKEQVAETSNKPVLIAEGDAVEQCLREARESFLELVNSCASVICCRMTPGQKQAMVRAVKQQQHIVTLAVGDGANDVAMILEAHIGVGIYGEEGMQSVQASDYALGEFKYLWELLLVHGRFNYIRQSEMIKYFFYKNLAFTIPQLFFAFYNAYSGQTVFDDWYITFYNMIFTALPLSVRALFEQDLAVPRRTDLTKPGMARIRDTVPRLYRGSRENTSFTAFSFFSWLFVGTLHAALAFFVPLYAAEDGLLDDSGQVHSLWSVSITTFTSIIVVVNLKLAVHTVYWNWLHLVSIFGLSVGVYFAFIMFYDSMHGSWGPGGTAGTVAVLIQSWYYWGSILAVSCLVVSLDAGISFVQRIRTSR